jgi:hypothetical protein
MGQVQVQQERAGGGASGVDKNQRPGYTHPQVRHRHTVIYTRKEEMKEEARAMRDARCSPRMFSFSD